MCLQVSEEAREGYGICPVWWELNPGLLRGQLMPLPSDPFLQSRIFCFPQRIRLPSNDNMTLNASILHWQETKNYFGGQWRGMPSCFPCMNSAHFKTRTCTCGFPLVCFLECYRAHLKDRLTSAYSSWPPPLAHTKWWWVMECSDTFHWLWSPVISREVQSCTVWGSVTEVQNSTPDTIFSKRRD